MRIIAHFKHRAKLRRDKRQLQEEAMGMVRHYIKEQQEKKAQKELEKDTYMFDFRNYEADRDFFIDDIEAVSGSDGINGVPVGKIQKKPIDVLDELETIPKPFDLLCLDDKILILKEKESLIKQHYAKREVSGLIERLQNRKKYAEYKEFFERWENTNDEKIEKLLSKYELVMKASDLFIPEFPDEAINRMREYAAKCEELCAKKPVFYVIATSDKFEQAEKRRDPILLVQSPFGFYWQILGAWDKEMLILHEL